jgi:electron transfer flavoprotein beta subunit
VRIVVLLKPVPDPASGAERLGPDQRLDRAAAPPVINGNDEYALEAALKMAGTDGEVILLAMAPENGLDALRKGLAMGAHRAVLVTDDALAGSDWLATSRVLAAALGELEFDLVLAGADTSDGGGGVVAAGAATLAGLPYLSYAAAIEARGERVRVKRITASGYEEIETPTPAVIACTQALGAPRYPSLKGIMAARSKEITRRSLAELGVDSATVGTAAAGTTVLDSRKPEARAATKVVRETPDEAARQLVAFLAERRIV